MVPPAPLVRRAAVATRAGLRESDTGLLVLALLVGLATGAGAVAFRYLIVVFTYVFTGTADYAATPGAPHGWLGWGRWFLVLTPVLAGLLYGPLVQRFAREARGHGVPEVMVAVARNGGRIPAKVAVVKSLASALCIGGGGSVGREGPIVQIGAALGSSLGQLTRVAEDRQRLLVACGAAGGIAATFNAPLAGVVFAMELVLRDFAARSFGMVVVSAVTASVVGRGFLGSQAFLDLPGFTVDHLLAYGLFALLGVVGACTGVLFTRVLYAIEDLCDWAWRGPEWLRPAVGGVLLGLLLLAVPQMYGVGYPVLTNAVEGRYVIGFLVLLLLAKIVATSLTIGIGGSGGVFAPSLFIGAALGAAFGQTAAVVAPGLAGAPGAYALVGMAAVFAGAARAPITAVLIVFEITGEYSLILPLMFAVVLSTGISHLLTRDSIYTAKLRRRGVDIDAAAPSWAAGRAIRSLQLVVPVVLHVDTPVPQAADALAGASALPVVDDDGYLGVVTARALADQLADDDPASLLQPDGRPSRLADLVDTRPIVGPADTVARGLELLDTHGLDRLVVVEDGQVLGWFTGAAVLAQLRRG